MPLDHSRFFSACTVLSHGSIMLPPRQPRVSLASLRVYCVSDGFGNDFYLLVVIKDYESAFDAVTLIQIPSMITILDLLNH